MRLKSRQQPVGPIFHVAPVRREIAVELQAFQNLNAAEFVQTRLNHIHRPAKMLKGAVPARKARGLDALDSNTIKGFEQRLEIRLQLDFIGPPRGAPEQSDLPAFAQAIRETSAASRTSATCPAARRRPPRYSAISAVLPVVDP